MNRRRVLYNDIQTKLNRKGFKLKNEIEEDHTMIYSSSIKSANNSIENIIMKPKYIYISVSEDNYMRIYMVVQVTRTDEDNLIHVVDKELTIYRGNIKSIEYLETILKKDWCY